LRTILVVAWGVMTFQSDILASTLQGGSGLISGK
jgi:hypothetical protein